MIEDQELFLVTQKDAKDDDPVLMIYIRLVRYRK